MRKLTRVDTSGVCVPEVNPVVTEWLTGVDIREAHGESQGNTTLVLGDIGTDLLAQDVVGTLGDLRCEDAGRVGGVVGGVGVTSEGLVHGSLDHWWVTTDRSLEVGDCPSLSHGGRASLAELLLCLNVVATVCDELVTVQIRVGHGADGSQGHWEEGGKGELHDGQKR